MNIKFESVDIENFRSIEKAEIKLENQGTVIVKGINEYEDKATSNGSGKSSIFEAIIFAIFEETSSGEKDVSNRILNNGYTITLVFYIDSDKYTICRQCKNNKTSVVFLKNGVDISARNKTDTNKLILQTIGISKSIFLDSVFLSQNANTNLASLSPTARKERLEILTNTDSAITQFKDKLKDIQIMYENNCVNDQLEINKLIGIKEANIKQQNDIQSKIDQINLEIERLKQLGDLNEIEKQIYEKDTIDLPDIEQAIDSITVCISEKEQEISNLRLQGENNIKQKEDLDRQKQDKLAEWTRVNAEIDKNKLSNHLIEQNILKIQADIENIKNSDKCPTCGRKLENADETHIQQTIQKYSADIQIEQNKIDENNKESAELSKKLQDIEAEGTQLNTDIIKISALVEGHKQLVNNKELERKDLVLEQQNLYHKKDECQLEINNLKAKKEQLLKTQINNINEFEEMLNKLKQEMVNIDNQIKVYENQYTFDNDLVGTVKNSIQMVTKEFRTYLLQNSLQYLNKLLSTYSSQLFSNSTDIIKIVEDDTKLNIKLGNATYESLSGGERTRVNIALLLAQKSLANIVGNISCNIIILDEILGYCDSKAEENVINLLTQELETLESIYMVSHKEIPIGYDTELTVIKDKQGLSRIINR